MADADLEAAAAEAIAWGIYYNAGETCHAGSRVIVHASVKDELLAGIAARGAEDHARQSLRSRDSDGCADRSGAHAARARLHRYRCRGGRARRAWRQGGHDRERRLLCRATILDGVRPQMRVSREEIFGPVLAVTDLRRGVRSARLANDSDLRSRRRGLDLQHQCRASPLRRAARRHRVGQQLRSLFRCPRPSAASSNPGFGRDRSPHAIDKYVDLKTIWTAYK